MFSFRLAELHPIVVHFPIALLIASVALDFGGIVLRRAGLTTEATWCLTLGVPGAFAALTGGLGVDTAIEALGADTTFQNCVRVTKPGGTISNIGYHGAGEFVHLPRVEWGVGMAEKTIATGLCPGGRLRMERLLRLLEMKRVDPTLMTTHARMSVPPDARAIRPATGRARSAQASRRAEPEYV
jgi:threonine dehydrogenase-like Zn-dependent dehydrogenase